MSPKSVVSGILEETGSWLTYFIASSDTHLRAAQGSIKPAIVSHGSLKIDGSCPAEPTKKEDWPEGSILDVVETEPVRRRATHGRLPKAAHPRV